MVDRVVGRFAHGDEDTAELTKLADPIDISLLYEKLNNSCVHQSFMAATSVRI